MFLGKHPALGGQCSKAQQDDLLQLQGKPAHGLRTCGVSVPVSVPRRSLPPVDVSYLSGSNIFDAKANKQQVYRWHAT